jgi:hypothetical protein
MSLIDEALKRAEIEAARRDGLKVGAYPWVPEHAPRRRRPWVAVVMVFVCTAALVAGVFWFRKPQAKVQSPVSKVQSRSDKALETVEVAPPPAGKPSRAPATTRETSDSQGVAKSKRSVAPPAGEPRSVNVAPEGKAAHGLADGKTYVGEVTVPDGAKIELGGIVFSESNPVALINDKVLGPGAVVEEFTIVSIQPDRVEMKGRGVTIFLALK